MALEDFYPTQQEQIDAFNAFLNGLPPTTILSFADAGVLFTGEQLPDGKQVEYMKQIIAYRAVVESIRHSCFVEIDKLKSKMENREPDYIPSRQK